MHVQPNPIYIVVLSIALGIAGVQFIRHALRGIPGRVRVQAPRAPVLRLSRAEVVVRVGLGAAFVLVAVFLCSIAVLQIANHSAMLPGWLYLSALMSAICMLLLLIIATVLAAVRYMQS